VCLRRAGLLFVPDLLPGLTSGYQVFRRSRQSLS
jgi:hypothetical protein